MTIKKFWEGRVTLLGGQLFSIEKLWLAQPCQLGHVRQSEHICVRTVLDNQS